MVAESGLNDMLYYLLSICFFLAFIAAVLKTIRYLADYRRFGRFFYLVGIPANGALALALALIIVGSGPDPIWRNAVTIIAVRLAIATWAVFSLLFEILYSRTYLIIVVDGDYTDVDTHGD